MPDHREFQERRLEWIRKQLSGSLASASAPAWARWEAWEAFLQMLRKRPTVRPGNALLKIWPRVWFPEPWRKQATYLLLHFEQGPSPHPPGVIAITVPSGRKEIENNGHACDLRRDRLHVGCGLERVQVLLARTPTIAGASLCSPNSGAVSVPHRLGHPL